MFCIVDQDLYSAIRIDCVVRQEMKLGMKNVPTQNILLTTSTISLYLNKCFKNFAVFVLSIREGEG